MFGWLFKNAVASPQEQGATDWQYAPVTDDPPCTCRECQRARAAHLADLGMIPGVAGQARAEDRTRWATDPTVYEEPAGLLGRMFNKPAKNGDG